MSTATDIREALAAWDKATHGDSNDAEYEAGLDMADVLRGVLMEQDILGRLWEHADDYEAEVISQLARKAGILWQCHASDAQVGNLECLWDNREDDATCGSCGASRPEREAGAP